MMWRTLEGAEKWALRDLRRDEVTSLLNFISTEQARN